MITAMVALMLIACGGILEVCRRLDRRYRIARGDRK